MTKQEFVDAVAGKTGMSKRDAGVAVEAFLGTVEDALKAGDTVTFTGFGKFHTTHRAARRASIRGTRARRCRSRRRTCRSSRPARCSRRPSTSATTLLRGRPDEGPLPRGPSLLRLVTRTYVRLESGGCNSRSMPPTGSSSSSRRAAGRFPADEAARALFALASAPTAIARSLLDEVVSGDARLAWRGAAVGLADAPGAAMPLEAATFVVFDLETTGLSPARSRIVEIGAQRVERLELGAAFETLVNPGVPLPAAITALTGIGRDDVRAAPGRRSRRAPVPRVRRRRRARRPQRAVRHGLPRPRRRAAHRPAGRRAGRRHGVARAAAARRAHDAVRARSRSRTSSARRVDAVPSRARRCVGDGGDPDRADRARAGARRRDGRRSRRARRRRGPGACTAKRSLVAGAPTTPGTLHLPRRARAGALRRARPRPARAAALVLLRRAGSGRPSRRRSARSRSVDWQLMRERARGGARRAAAASRAATAGERARHAARSAGVSPASRRALGLRQRADPARPDRRPRHRAASRPGARRVRGRGSRARRSPGCGSAFAASQPICASRMPPACATASPRSSRWSTGSTSCDRLRALRACLVVPGARAGHGARDLRGGRRSSRGGRSRAVAVAGSRSRQGSPTYARSRRRELARDDRRRASPDRVLPPATAARASGRARSSATRSSPRRTG